MNQLYSISHIEASIEKGIEFIFSRLNREGSWYDFRLPPGASGPWVTAYTGYHLIKIINERKLVELLPQLNKPVKWLISNRDSNGGWGYNLFCPSDADATAYAILFIKEMKDFIPKSAYNFLIHFQNKDGGFSTYRSLRKNDAWDSSHPDVTPVAGMALLDTMKSFPDKINKLKNYITQNQTAEGYWESYWWASSLYSTARNLDFICMTDTEYSPLTLCKNIKQYYCKTPLEYSYRAYCLLKMLIEPELPEISELCKIQLQDGSWQSYPSLRLTPRSCYEPWSDKNSGVLYCDDNRILTSVTILRTLSLYLSFRQTNSD